ncbi:MAG: hypothetical protein K0R54_6109, partial [Clostridiaceae bacterium]|nr:hypothetical protein [Clostridiaceae bacterium]
MIILKLTYVNKVYSKVEDKIDD